jgi:hypothetical protein
MEQQIYLTNPNFYRANGTPRIGLENIFEHAGNRQCKTVDEVKKEICNGEIYPADVKRFRGVGPEILKVFFPFGTETREIKENVTKYQLEESRRQIALAFESLVFSDTEKAMSILAKKQTEFCMSRGLPYVVYNNGEIPRSEYGQKKVYYFEG